MPYPKDDSFEINIVVFKQTIGEGAGHVKSGVRHIRYPYWRQDNERKNVMDFFARAGQDAQKPQGVRVAWQVSLTSGVKSFSDLDLEISETWLKFQRLPVSSGRFSYRDSEQVLVSKSGPSSNKCPPKGYKNMRLIIYAGGKLQDRKKKDDERKEEKEKKDGRTCTLLLLVLLPLFPAFQRFDVVLVNGELRVLHATFVVWWICSILSHCAPKFLETVVVESES